ncbi:beta-ketoacyl-ACP synthase II [Arthrobacter sp. zg-Y20]|uniref:beta-ketoacyl-[acyl-carrier-protein] synthase family protein n=1 Tax=unclassified Arthrobacter TaxID=235627 RepID=UPI001D13FAA3|nr:MULTISPECIES: beta-ketoacyl-ACP synthase II [unclassified Arthrobacter]MCC3276186.1 beta-ketoacyl-ACP synthase II [Arthrobacter sp. zg-Y20]MDK1316346.1 beta-ketoacyl-ACP synthase II [Arthrobacter sp. zg.Y20]WIB06395.1 beta-ketoacyl-ACP synthase II [Arthrobacter sp. zg-Y20]
MAERVVITGMGALTPLGNTWPDTWSGLLAGRSGIDKITAFDASDFPTRIAGEVKNFDPGQILPVKRLRRSSRASHLAVAAAREAVADAGLGGTLEGTEAAVILNSAVSGYPEVQDATETLHRDGLRPISPSFVASSLTNMPACEVAIDLAVHGPVNASALACASGTAALLEARRTLLAGEADVVVAGGTDAAITPVMFAGLSAMRGLSRNNDSPQEASRPFDAGRDGFVFGEGSVVCVLELLSHARARGAEVYAEVLGGAMTSDAFHIVAPDPSGRYAAAAITQTLSRARLNPEDVDLVAAHGTSTLANDRTETLALHTAFGEHASSLAVTAPKSMTGHLIGAAGTLGSLLCAMAIRDGVIPPTINYSTPDPECDLDYVPGTARETPVRFAVTDAFGFGGQNAVAAFGAV